MQLLPRSLAPCAFLLVACPLPEFGELPPVCDPQTEQCPPLEATTTTSTTTSTTTTDDTPTEGIQTVTGPASSSSSGEPGTTTGGTTGTTGEPLLPPAIVDHVLSPDPLSEPGIIELSVFTEHAAGVRMQVDDGDAIELAAEPGKFVGEIPIYTGLPPKTHHATLIPWRDGLDGEPVVVPFEVDLPPPGEGYVWESANLIGLGTVASIAALPAGDDDAAMVEWGTYYPDGHARCYLRRRDKVGAWSPADFVELQPGIDCIAIDLAAAPDGALYLLASRKTGDDPRWWLGRVGTWATAAAPENLGSGGPGDTAHALALGKDKVAVCGTHPTDGPVDKIDAAVSIVGEPMRLFDYEGPDLKPHTFDETLRDCIFDGETLVGVGDVHGKHSEDPMEPKRRRHLRLRFDLGTDSTAPHVGAELGAATQSVANAVALDGAGRVVTVGYLCADACKPDAQLWVHAADGTLEWYASLGADLAAPFSIATSPAGYLVLGGARKKGPAWSSFWISAYFIGDYEPAWTFERDDAPVFQYASAVAVGPAGHVYGGGVGANGYPAVAYVSP